MNTSDTNWRSYVGPADNGKLVTSLSQNQLPKKLQSTDNAQ